MLHCLHDTPGQSTIGTSEIIQPQAKAAAEGIEGFPLQRRLLYVDTYAL